MNAKRTESLLLFEGKLETSVLPEEGFSRVHQGKDPGLVSRELVAAAVIESVPSERQSTACTSTMTDHSIVVRGASGRRESLLPRFVLPTGLA